MPFIARVNQRIDESCIKEQPQGWVSQGVDPLAASCVVIVALGQISDAQISSNAEQLAQRISVLLLLFGPGRTGVLFDRKQIPLVTLQANRLFRPQHLTVE